MKQYFTGVFSAFCISISLFLFLDKDIKASNDTKTDKIIIDFSFSIFINIFFAYFVEFSIKLLIHL